MQAQGSSSGHTGSPSACAADHRPAQGLDTSSTCLRCHRGHWVWTQGCSEIYPFRSVNISVLSRQILWESSVTGPQPRLRGKGSCTFSWLLSQTPEMWRLRGGGNLYWLELSDVILAKEGRIFPTSQDRQGEAHMLYALC